MGYRAEIRVERVRRDTGRPLRKQQRSPQKTPRRLFIKAEEIVNHNLGSNVDGHIWVEHGAEDMLSKVLKDDVDQFSEFSDDDSIDGDDGGIRHVVSAMKYQNLNIESYVDSCYMREDYKTGYENNVSPINGMDMWPNVDVEDILSPQYKKGSGRLKKPRDTEKTTKMKKGTKKKRLQEIKLKKRMARKKVEVHA
ncbi:hypothetical protein KIW84_045692 [Lathyrus oleraceus]|uniref:Uncharacterized protein n=1 Tax=Pisum sativum TaxID=3888 RepID=A0A9D5AXJ6_PEA|nr:hypothetical protein KIW84_045692 [Pisum sativum]